MGVCTNLFVLFPQTCTFNENLEIYIFQRDMKKKINQFDNGLKLVILPDLISLLRVAALAELAQANNAKVTIKLH